MGRSGLPNLEIISACEKKIPKERDWNWMGTIFSLIL